MDAKKLLVVLFLQLCMVALGGAAETCAQPGALRCEEGRHQSVCLEPSHVWHRVRDCAAAGGFCADGRCVEGRSGREDSCTIGTYRCSDDCLRAQLCITGNVWYLLEECDEATQRCDFSDSIPKCVSDVEADCPNSFACTIDAIIPDLQDSSIYYECLKVGVPAIQRSCENGTYFDACTGKCDLLTAAHHYPSACRSVGRAEFLPTNPSLYFICLGYTTLWAICPQGYFESELGECVGSGIYCGDCRSSDSQNPNDSSDSNTSESTTTTTTSTTTPPTPDPSKCTGIGSKIPDPTDECYYYSCLQSGSIVRRKCDSGSIFSELYRDCIASEGACS